MHATGELVAGCELDALVAEKVMGWRRRPLREVIAIYAKAGPWADTPDNHWYDADNILVADANETFDDDGREILPWSPSTNVATAWQVVDQVTLGREMGFNLWRENMAFREYEAKFYPDAYVEYLARAETAPLAICLAALKAVSQAE